MATARTSETAFHENALRTLRASRAVLLEPLDEISLLQQICQTIVDVGGYRLAWIGYAQNDERRTVKPMASAGDVGYMSGLNISWGDNVLGRGPTGVAIRTNSIQVTPDVRAVSAYLPWRDRALAHGFRTSCVLPLRHRRKSIGALCIYSGELGAFDAPSVRVLEELAAELTQGIAAAR